MNNEMAMLIEFLQGAAKDGNFVEKLNELKLTLAEISKQKSELGALESYNSQKIIELNGLLLQHQKEMQQLDQLKFDAGQIHADASIKQARVFAKEKALDGLEQSLNERMAKLELAERTADDNKLVLDNSLKALNAEKAFIGEMCKEVKSVFDKYFK